jgi:hypothetical protein
MPIIKNYTLCPLGTPPTKIQILNALINQVAFDAQAHFRACHVRVELNSAIRQRIDTIYKAEVQVMDELYKIKYA